MILYEMLERVREYDAQKGRTRIVRDLNQQIVHFSREAKLLSKSCDFFTQGLVDNDGWELTNERGEVLECSRYTGPFPLPSECYDLTRVECSDPCLTYRLDNGVFSFFHGTDSVTFTPDTTTTITLHYHHRPAFLKEDGDAPEFHSDFHEGPVWALLAMYAALKGDKQGQYFAGEAARCLFEAKVYASKLNRQFYDVQPVQWSK